MNILDLKAYLKASAAELKTLHRCRKAKNLLPGETKSSNGTIQEKGRTHRHHFIAYCELRGTQRDRIERPRQDNQPSETWIARIKEDYGTPLHTDAPGPTACL